MRQQYVQSNKKKKKKNHSFSLKLNISNNQCWIKTQLEGTPSIQIQNLAVCEQQHKKKQGVKSGENHNYRKTGTVNNPYMNNCWV